MSLKKKKKSSLNSETNGNILRNIYLSSNNENEFIIKLNNYLLNKNKLTKKHSTKLRKNTLQGKSGASIFKTNHNTIIKTYNTSKINLKHIHKNCISINAKYNEIVLNTILAHYNHFIKINDLESKLLDTHILKTKDIFINKNKIYIETPLCKYIASNNKSYTTLEDILFKNIRVINTLFLKKQYKIILKFDDVLTNHILKPIINTLQILKKKLNFIHSDIKFKNIFINKIKNPSLKIKDLQKYNLDLDFTPLIADFDKSSVIYNNINLIPYGSSTKLNLLKITGRYIIEDIRHKCQTQLNNNKICKLYTNYEIDYLIIFINLYLIIYIQSNQHFIEISNKLMKLKKYTQKILKLNEDTFQLFLKTLKKKYDPSIKQIRVSNHISLIIYYFCKQLDKYTSN